jgi:sugar O-acyltransferase (sialic acid O-acetyltransferase NeuD family)
VALTSILLVGAGGHAASCIDVIEQHGGFTVVGLIGEAHEVGQSVLNYPVLGTDADLPALIAHHRNALVTVGQIKSPQLRMRLFERLKRLGATLPAIISPRGYVSPHARVGEGTIVMHGAVVNARASVGNNCILNTLSLVEHDAIVADHCHIATAAVINGEVTIAAGTFVGSNTSIRQCVHIGERCLIGMGQRILADCEADTTVPPLEERS